MSYKTVIKNILGKRADSVPQDIPLPGQIPNNAGGHFYAVDDWARLDRFLILGTEGGTYYVGENRLTVENANVVLKCLEADGQRTLRRIIEISTQGRAPKAQPALFALALAASSKDDSVRKAALDALPQVARTGTHVLTFASYINDLRGWGRGLRRGVARWFTGMPVDRLALQSVKYRQREGWALRDLLRLAHPLTDEMDRRVLFDWIAHPDKAEAISSARDASPLVDGLHAVKDATSASEVARLVHKHSLPREGVPTEWLDSAEVWDALLVDMPMTAMIRNLGKMSAVGLISTGSDAATYVADRLADSEQLRKARIHPIQALIALKTYARGQGLRGSLEWQAVPAVIDALDTAYEKSFTNVVPTGKKILVAVDVSGSMYWHGYGSTPLGPMEAAAAIAHVFLRTEENVEVIAVDTKLYFPGLSGKQRLDDVMNTLERFGGGGTDLNLPFQYALKEKRTYDAIIQLTDNETWAGRYHPVTTIDLYRNRINQDAKAVIMATTANQGSVVPEDDQRNFGVAGFDAAAPTLVGDFIRG